MGCLVMRCALVGGLFDWLVGVNGLFGGHCGIHVHVVVWEYVVIGYIVEISGGFVWWR
jgi:hypothetical protein